MNIYILTDLEGPAGVSLWRQTREKDSPSKLPVMRLLTAEINATIDGILDVAPQARILVWDGHGSGGIIFEEIHPAAEVLMHGPGNGPRYGLDESFNAQFFVGQHAMAGTPNAPLCHTYSSRTVEYYKLNGQLVGEFACRAALAGSLGVPTAFIAGDDKACAEAARLIPNIVTVPTKTGLGIELAIHLSPQAARARIRAGAAQAIQRLPEIAPYVVAPPYEQEVRVLEGAALDSYLRRGATRIDDRTAVKRSDRLDDLFV